MDYSDDDEVVIEGWESFSAFRKLTLLSIGAKFKYVFLIVKIPQESALKNVLTIEIANQPTKTLSNYYKE